VQLNWLMRYQPVVRLLDDLPNGSVLDVGSGRHGLTAYRAGTIVSTDLAFLGEPPQHDVRPVLVAATAECLPFADASFDYAVSLDMFEHLPTGIRERSVQELCRVSRRGVVVGFPVGRSAKAVDTVLYHLMRLARRGVPDWLSEHREQSEYPDRDMLSTALPPTWSITREVKSGNVVVQTTVVLAEHVPGAHRASRSLESRWRIDGVPRWLDKGLSYRMIYLVEPVEPIPRL
jgi:SAM-dependent methyltransferase